MKKRINPSEFPEFEEIEKTDMLIIKICIVINILVILGQLVILFYF